MRVPKELQAVVGKHESRFALDPGRRRSAKRKSKETSHNVKGLFKQLKVNRYGQEFDNKYQ
jgi:hypothetical protein